MPCVPIVQSSGFAHGSKGVRRDTLDGRNEIEGCVSLAQSRWRVTPLMRYVFSSEEIGHVLTHSRELECPLLGWARSECRVLRWTTHTVERRIHQTGQEQIHVSTSSRKDCQSSYLG
jgi:hypothetical protein